MRTSSRTSEVLTKTDCIVIFSSETLGDMQHKGGCGWWPIGKDPQTLKKHGVEYVACVLNKKGNPQHHKLLFVARLVGNVKVKEPKAGNGKARQFLYFDEVAELTKSIPVKRDFYYTSLKSLGIRRGQLNFKRFSPTGPQPPKKKPPPIDQNPGKGGGANPGQEGEGARKNATWSAKSSPLFHKLHARLVEIGWHVCNDSLWRPDLLVTKKGAGRVLFEIKPSFSDHNVITAVGQLLCYRTPHPSTTISVIAAEGAPKQKFDQIFRDLRVKTLNLRGRDWKVRLDDILSG